MPGAERYAPGEFRAIYLSSWSAATESRIEGVIGLEREGLINAVVIDIKDATGRVAFNTTVPQAEASGARQPIITDIGGLVRRLQSEGLYVIARIVVFVDPIMAEARPDIAVHSREKLADSGGALSRGTLWRDNRGLAWMDPAASAVWEYNAAIAADALGRGFNEVNFDYVRFPSGGELGDMVFPAWRGQGPKRLAIRAFFAYLRRELTPGVISVDLFGLATVSRDDLGVGQVIEDAFPYFDYICPMVYPSLYASGFAGAANPAERPYEVVYRSLRSAAVRLAAQDEAIRSKVRIRPWLQDFNLGAKYTPEMVVAQIRAARDTLGDGYVGFALWNPRNVYQTEALRLSAAEYSQRLGQSVDTLGHDTGAN